MQHFCDLLHLEAGPFGAVLPSSACGPGSPSPSLAGYYRRGLPIVADPGTTFAYCNHGYATLGQIVEDVSGMSLERYFRERIFDPLGMPDTGLVRSARIAARLATGYALGRRGVQAVPDPTCSGWVFRSPGRRVCASCSAPPRAARRPCTRISAGSRYRSSGVPWKAAGPVRCGPLPCDPP
ncbi:serine hydrolase domain-containing protein [Planobispora longispora]|uniref:Beta-lactamase-related domain-containing protein n=1 Tax=Planobispora longispora TaxID=28887 RepID=A0A8J3W7W9_9ACTN|nr:serine hydrolase domain-containing protein [Planobispora longispora]BFE79422.1 hypothetical protein GCM10020093_020230 [Planobispora longispora]GIH78241.1 hypothetical protein Plo01_46700 [Planobispora longispora]